MTLRRGDNGQHVLILQRALQDAGIALPVYGVDGIFGPETESAVKQAQGLFQMEPNGIADQKLFNALGIEKLSSPALQADKSKLAGMTQWIIAGLLIGGLVFAVKKGRK